MSYHYTALEEALEYAGSRLPLDLFRNLIGQVEDTITSSADGSTLERKIYKMVEEYNQIQPRRAFSVERLKSASA